MSDGDLTPLPETEQAIEQLEAMTDGGGLLNELISMGARVREVVPDCVGFSLSALEHGVTFTLLATSEDIRRLDATQYVDGGPCLEAVHVAEALETQPDTMAEEDWQLFARATAARGIASTLSMPILTEGEVTGGVNLYAKSPNAFTGHHEELAVLLGAWAQGAVTNADLSFTSLERARKAPQALRDATQVDVATGVLAAARQLSLEEAQQRIERAAAQAGLAEIAVAHVVLEILSATE